VGNPLASLGGLQAPILLKSYDSRDELVEKVNRYSTLAEQLGFLDGWDGLMLAAIGGPYDILKYAKLRDLEKGRATGSRSGQ
jgi:hypothetical protein